MNRADPAELRKALKAARLCAKAGVLFVVVPVLSPSEYADLKGHAIRQLKKLTPREGYFKA